MARSFQRTSIFQDLTVHEQLHLVAQHLGDDRLDDVIEVMDLSGLEREEREERVRELTQAEVQQGFDLERGPLLRAAVLRLSGTEHVLLLTVHHIISDGWSQGCASSWE